MKSLILTLGVGAFVASGWSHGSAPTDGDVVINERYHFVTFGQDVLERSNLIVEGRAISVNQAGPGVAVAAFDVDHVFLGELSNEEVVVLCLPGEFSEEVNYLLFLESFQGGDRYAPIRRIAEGDRDYKAKRRVLDRYGEITLIEDTTERALRIRDALMDHLGDDDIFVKWNALSELVVFAPGHRQLFGPFEKAAMVSVYRGEESPTFRRTLRATLEDLGIHTDEDRSSP